MTPNFHESDGAAGTVGIGYADKAEVAAAFGITTRTLESWMRRGFVPFFKIGKTVRFDMQSVRAHLESNHRVGSSRGGQ